MQFLYFQIKNFDFQQNICSRLHIIDFIKMGQYGYETDTSLKPIIHMDWKMELCNRNGIRGKSRVRIFNLNYF